ncbi:MAG: hypothetical protein WCS43_10370 [Verrucomicrobiota bacterium]
MNVVGHDGFWSDLSVSSMDYQPRRATAAASIGLRSWRNATRVELENYFRNRRSPRMLFSSILMLTGVAGFVLCQIMLKLGLVLMWIRYPLAVLGAYGLFLLLMRAWVAWEHFRFDHRLVSLPEPPPGAVDNRFPENETQRRSHADSGDHAGWLDWLDFGFADLFEAEGCLLVLLFGLLIAAIGFLGGAIADAPILIADVFLDSVLVSVLYRSLRRSDSSRWLGTAVRKTYGRALWLAVLLGVFGAVLQMLAPNCHSIGPAVRELSGSENGRH